jgi:hypothetical protein
MKRDMIAIALLLWMGGAWGQVYKCGNTYSDKPCGTKVVRLSGTGAEEDSQAASPSSGDGLPEYVTACLNAVRATRNFPDKENLRVDHYAKTWQTFDYADKRILGLLVTLKINPMGSAGSYTGARPFSCQMSEDGRRVLKVSGL